MIVLTTPVYMTEEDVKRFLLFQKYYEVFKKLDEGGAFDIKYGKITLNFNDSKLQHIVKEEIVYHN